MCIEDSDGVEDVYELGFYSTNYSIPEIFLSRIQKDFDTLSSSLYLKFDNVSFGVDQLRTQLILPYSESEVEKEMSECDFATFLTCELTIFFVFGYIATAQLKAPAICR
jgi:hypothetical protein